MKLQTLCRAGEPAHPIRLAVAIDRPCSRERPADCDAIVAISLKSLTNVNFHLADSTLKESTTKDVKEGDYTCPSCRKTLSNNVASYVLRPCGHVLCVSDDDAYIRPHLQVSDRGQHYLQHTCVETLVKKTSPRQCAHCDAVLLSEKKNPIIELKREGTGYAAGGLAEAKRFGVSFQA